jgi:hypothetical protein
MKTERGTHPAECYRCKETIPAGEVRCRTLITGYFQRLHLACAQVVLAERATQEAKRCPARLPQLGPAQGGDRR